LNDPELVILDEMRTGLDPAARHTAWDLVRAVRDAGTSVVLVTHFMEEAERLCDRVAVHERGTVVALGAPGALIAEHTGQVTVRFSAGAGDLGWLAAVAGVDQVARRWPTTPRATRTRGRARRLAARRSGVRLPGYLAQLHSHLCGALGAGLGQFFVMMMLSGAGPPVRGDDRRHAARQRHPPAHLRDPDPAGTWLGTGLARRDVAVALAIAAAAAVIARAAFRWE